MSGPFDQCDTGFDDVERIDARRLGELGTQFDDELGHERGGDSKERGPNDDDQPEVADETDNDQHPAGQHGG